MDKRRREKYIYSSRRKTQDRRRIQKIGDIILTKEGRGYKETIDRKKIFQGGAAILECRLTNMANKRKKELKSKWTLKRKE